MTFSGPLWIGKKKFKPYISHEKLLYSTGNTLLSVCIQYSTQCSVVT